MSSTEQTKKLSWDEVYKEFRRTHPKLKNYIIDWRPFDYATIMLYFKDGSRMTYDCTTKECKFVS